MELREYLVLIHKDGQRVALPKKGKVTLEGARTIIRGLDRKADRPILVCTVVDDLMAEERGR